MSFATYAELQSELAAWVGRNDSRLLARIPTAIELVETQVRRMLRTMRGEDEAVLTLLSGAATVALPDMFIGLRSDPEFEDGTGRTIRQVSAPFIQNELIQIGLPEVYFIGGNTMHFRPASDGARDIKIYYYTGLTALSDACPSNWLLAFYPHVYFFGGLAELFKFAGGSARRRRDKWSGRFARAIGDVLDIDSIDRWNGTPMAMHSRVIPLDSPFLRLHDPNLALTGLPEAGPVAQQGLAASFSFPTMSAVASLQAGSDFTAHFNFPVMSQSATLAPPGELAAAFNFPVMSQVASFESEVTLISEDFQGTVGSWVLNTPGVDDAEDAFSREENATPTGSTGPSGGANATTRAPTAGNGYAYTEASIGADSPWSMETPDLDASLGLITMTFDLHMRFGSVGGITDGTLEVQGWDGAAWSTISNTVVGSQQTAAGDDWLASTGFGTYDSTGFSNADFKFRFLFTRGLNVNTANYDCSIDNVIVTGPPGAI